jgi:hypothetical protein
MERTRQRWLPTSQRIARSIKSGTGVIDLTSDHRALRRPDGSNVVARAVEHAAQRVRNDGDEEAV